MGSVDFDDYNKLLLKKRSEVTTDGITFLKTIRIAKETKEAVGEARTTLEEAKEEVNNLTQSGAETEALENAKTALEKAKTALANAETAAETAAKAKTALEQVEEEAKTALKEEEAAAAAAVKPKSSYLWRGGKRRKTRRVKSSRTKKCKKKRTNPSCRRRLRKK
jgi:type I site-specific restriction-modification system R (restriction) subunit